MRKILILAFLTLFAGCTPTATATPTTTSTSTRTSTLTPTSTPVPITLAVLPAACRIGGQIVSAELAQPAGGDPYSYQVYLPPCYVAESDFHYPVLYLIPGSRSSPDSWLKAGIPDEMDRLILAKIIPPMIIVVTENTDSNPWAETIYNELIPAVESQYPVAAERRYRAVAGASLGGFSAYRLAFQHPDTFSSAGIFGAGVMPGEEAQVRLWLSRLDEAELMRVFMNTGTDDPGMLERAQAMKSILDEAGVENELYVDNAGHHYTYWVANFEMYLRWLSKDWQ